MKKKTINKRRISKECWGLDYAWLEWLRERLPVFLKEADRVVNLEYHTFSYRGKTWTQKALIEELIKLLKSIDGKDEWDDGYVEVCDDIIDIWKLIYHYMWW